MDFNVYIVSTNAHVILTSIKIFGRKKMQSGRQEKYLFSKYFKENINEM